MMQSVESEFSQSVGFSQASRSYWVETSGKLSSLNGVNMAQQLLRNTDMGVGRPTLICLRCVLNKEII